MAVEQVRGQCCEVSAVTLPLMPSLLITLPLVPLAKEIKHKPDEETKLTDIWQETTGTHC